MQLLSHTHTQMHKVTPLPFFPLPPTYVHPNFPFSILSTIWANCRHPDGCFGLLALISAAEQSQTTQSHTIPTLAGPSILIPLGCVTAPTL